MSIHNNPISIKEVWHALNKMTRIHLRGQDIFYGQESSRRHVEVLLPFNKSTMICIISKIPQNLHL